VLNNSLTDLASQVKRLARVRATTGKSALEPLPPEISKRRDAIGLLPYSVVVTKHHRTAGKRAPEPSVFRPASARIDRLDAATRAKRAPAPCAVSNTSFRG